MENSANKPEVGIEYTGMVVIHSVLFKFNVTRTHLVEYENELNRNALDRLQDNAFTRSGFYNARTRKLIPSDRTQLLPGPDMMKFAIPKAFLKHKPRPDEIRIHNSQSLAYKFGILYIDQELSDRLNGKLPTLRFDGLEYQLDLKNREMCQIEAPEKKFSFQKRDIFEPSEGFYDLETKTPVVLDPGITSFPDNLVCVKFPRLNEMDVVGHAVLHQLPPYVLVSTYAWKPDPDKIKMLDVSQSAMANVVKSNAKKVEAQKNKTAENSNDKSVRRERKGKRNNL